MLTNSDKKSPLSPHDRIDLQRTQAWTLVPLQVFFSLQILSRPNAVTGWRIWRGLDKQVYDASRVT